jgi:hypothetical protein
MIGLLLGSFVHAIGPCTCAVDTCVLASLRAAAATARGGGHVKMSRAWTILQRRFSFFRSVIWPEMGCLQSTVTTGHLLAFLLCNLCGSTDITQRPRLLCQSLQSVCASTFAGADVVIISSVTSESVLRVQLAMDQPERVQPAEDAPGGTLPCLSSTGVCSLPLSVCDGMYTLSSVHVVGSDDTHLVFSVGHNGRWFASSALRGVWCASLHEIRDTVAKDVSVFYKRSVKHIGVLEAACQQCADLKSAVVQLPFEEWRPRLVAGVGCECSAVSVWQTVVDGLFQTPRPAFISATALQSLLSEIGASLFLDALSQQPAERISSMLLLLNKQRDESSLDVLQTVLQALVTRELSSLSLGEGVVHAPVPHATWLQFALETLDNSTEMVLHHTRNLVMKANESDANAWVYLTTPAADGATILQRVPVVVARAQQATLTACEQLCDELAKMSAELLLQAMFPVS